MSTNLFYMNGLEVLGIALNLTKLSSHPKIIPVIHDCPQELSNKYYGLIVCNEFLLLIPVLLPLPSWQ